MTLFLDFFQRNKIKVLMVCTANICRSPMAHAIFREMIKSRGLSHRVYVDSAGTHVPVRRQLADKRALSTLKEFNIGIEKLTTREFRNKDVEIFDYILVMDNRNIEAVCKQLGEKPSKLHLLMKYAPDKRALEVPDPYYGHPDEFREVFSLIESACDRLLEKIIKDHELEVLS